MSGLVISDPARLMVALSSDRIIPGDTLLLRAGTYAIGNGKGIYDIPLHGTEALPITIRNYPHENVRINDGLRVQTGSYINIRGIEIAPTPTARIALDRTGAGLDYPNAVTLYAAGCKVINCIVHDGLEGFTPMGCSPFTMYGNLVYNNGWMQADDGTETGYGVYSHNDPGALATIRHNIISQNYGTWGFHLNSAGNKIINYQLTENAIIGGGGGGVVFATANELDDCYAEENHMVTGGIRSGQAGYNSANKFVSMINNRIYCYGVTTTLANGDMQDIVFTGNKVVGEAYLTEMNLAYLATGSWDNNLYYTINTGLIKNKPFRLSDEVVPEKSLAEWRTATGYDANSTLTEGMPAANEVFVYPNEYLDADDDRMGIIVIWNWTSANSVDVDLTDLDLDIDENYRLRNSQDPYNDVINFTYDGDDLAVDMRAVSHTVAIPTGATNPVVNKGFGFSGEHFSINQFPVFGAFVVEKA